MQRCSNRISQLLNTSQAKEGQLHTPSVLRRAASTKPTPLYQRSQNQPPPSHFPTTPRTYGRVKNLSWEKAWQLAPLELLSQGLNCFPTTPLSNVSQTLHFPSAVPSFTPDYTHKAPAFLTHLWEHLGTEDRTRALSKQTHDQLQLQTLQVRVRPCQSLPVQEQSPWNQHFLSLIPELPQQQAW